MWTELLIVWSCVVYRIERYVNVCVVAIDDCDLACDGHDGAENEMQHMA